MNNCGFLIFNDLANDRGGLVSIEKNIPFEIKRIYFLHNTSDSHQRGFHAHKKLEQIIVPVSGSFIFTIDDGYKRIAHTLDDPAKGLYICPMIWREISNFSSNAVCLVLASEYYDEDDYIRNYQEFINEVHSK